MSLEEKKQGFRLLFDGESLAGWRNYRSQGVRPEWRVVDGTMVLCAKGGRDLITLEQFAYFDLRLEYTIAEGGNSGVMFRVVEHTEERHPWRLAPEYQLYDSFNVKVRGDRCAGALYGLIAAPKDLARKPGEWNQVRILLEPAGGNQDRLRFWLNGRQTVDILVDPAPHSRWSRLLKTAEGKGHFAKGFFRARSGHILLQDHGARVAFRNIRIRELDHSGLVGRWDFDDGTGKDLSGHGNDAELGGTRIHDLGGGRACLRIVPDTKPMRIPASADSALAIRRGTVCLWLNLAWEDSVTVLKYDNDAVQLRVYRRHFQPRVRGEDDFELGANVWGEDWPQFPLREGAFYPHAKAVVGEGRWHHFAVAYDDRAKRIIGWRDGERISVVDLSTLEVEPLKREDLEEILTDDEFVGFIDDLRIYNRILTDSDVREVFDSTQPVYAGRSDTMGTDEKMEVYAYQEQDGSLYRAWLQHKPRRRRRGEEMLTHIVAEGADSTVQTAAKELAEAVESMFGRAPSIESRPGAGSRVVLGTPGSSAWIRDKADELGLDRIEHDGYIIRALKDDSATTLAVAASLPAGVVFGAFDLVRRIQLGQDPRDLDVLENPQNAIRMVNHWDIFRGFPHDDWHGKRIDPYNWESNRNNSIYSWEDLRKGNTGMIRDWARLLASVGWNAVCPTEINWEFRNNFLDHLDEVETLADIFRDYGITLYWTPNYLLALKKTTADTLYSRVPDFGGYLLKLGSEKQNGDPRPAMVNRIADNLKPYGGHALVRAFVYGNYRYTREPYRNLIPYDIFAPEDGHYRENVILLSKGSPLDWDFAAPIPALDGAIRKNLYGSELVIAKSWPVSWIEKWKWWLEQDNYRNGPGSLNKLDTTCILGVSMISPAPAWTSCPLNMVNYYGLGRLAWNPDLSVDEIYTEWVRLTFGDDPDVLDNVKTILLLSDDVTRKLYMYRGYRGIWIDRGEDNLVQGKTPHTVSRQGIGVTSPQLEKRLLDQYAPGLREIYGDAVRGEEYLPYFHFVDFDYRLSNGRTVIEDIYANLDEAVEGAAKMRDLWRRLEPAPGRQGKVDRRRFQYTLDNLAHYVETARKQRNKMVHRFEQVTGRKYVETSGSDSRQSTGREIRTNNREIHSNVR